MLGKKDLRLLFWCFKIISTLGILPIKFDIGQAKVEILDSGWRYLLWKFWWYPNGLFYWLYMCIRLYQSFTNELMEFQYLAFHIALVSYSTIQSTWTIIIFVKNPKVTEALFNLCVHQISEQEKVSRKKYSTQEWFLILLPLLQVVSCIGSFTSQYKENRDSPQFLNSIIQIPEIFPLLVIYENCNYLYYLCVNLLAVYIQLGLLQNINDDLQEHVEYFRSMTSTREELLDSMDLNMTQMVRYCGRGREIELKLRLFNKVNAYIIYTYKINLILCAVTNWFFGIRFMDNPEFAANSLFLAAYLTSLYIVIYDKAFAVPGCIQDFKSEFLLMSRRILEMVNRKEEARQKSDEELGLMVSNPGVTSMNRNSDVNIETSDVESISSLSPVKKEGTRRSKTKCLTANDRMMKYIELHVKSIPDIGIQVGGFNTMERTSTPDFLDFMVNKVVDLLIMFP